MKFLTAFLALLCVLHLGNAYANAENIDETMCSSSSMSGVQGVAAEAPDSVGVSTVPTTGDLEAMPVSAELGDIDGAPPNPGGADFDVHFLMTTIPTSELTERAPAHVLLEYRRGADIGGDNLRAILRGGFYVGEVFGESDRLRC